MIKLHESSILCVSAFFLSVLLCGMFECTLTMFTFTMIVHLYSFVLKSGTESINCILWFSSLLDILVKSMVKYFTTGNSWWSFVTFNVFYLVFKSETYNQGREIVGSSNDKISPIVDYVMLLPFYSIVYEILVEHSTVKDRLLIVGTTQIVILFLSAGKKFNPTAAYQILGVIFAIAACLSYNPWILNFTVFLFIGSY